MKLIKVGATVDPPYVEPCFAHYPRGCTQPGLDIQFIYAVLSTVMRLDVKLIEYDNYTDVETAFKNDEIDMIGLTYGFTLGRSKKSAYSFIFLDVTMGFIVKSVRKSNISNFELFSIFSWQLWLALILVTILFCSIERILKMFTPPKFAIHRVAKFLLAFWMLTFGVIFECYGNFVTVNLVLPDHVETSFNNLTDLGNKLITSECQFAVLDRYKNWPDFNSMFFNPKHNRSWSKAFKTASFHNFPIYVQDRREMINIISNSSRCIVGLDYITDYQASFYSKICDLQVKVFPDEIEMKKVVYYHKFKDKRMVQGLNNVLASYPFMIYYQHLVKQISINKPCSTINSEEITTISLLHLRELFLCFFAILFAICVLFLAYKCYKFY